jgi:Zn-dependent peptidase ImmA (M78 family)
MSTYAARTAAEKLLQKLGISAAPIDVHSIAKELGIRVILEDLGAEVSGLLATRGQSSVIGVHRRHVSTRQRFTIAHELGHYVMGHQFQHGEHVHVDEGRVISERNARTSAGVDPKEVEANQFAAALLMPSKLVRMHAGRFGKGPLLEEEIAQLAAEFQVSEQAMTIRLGTLSLL